jgi:hypothetical protein
MHFTSNYLYLSLELRKMDALVHILYEVAGTCGALLSVKLIQIFGNNFSFLITPPLFALAGLTWSFVDRLGHGTDATKTIDAMDETKSIGKTNYIGSILTGAKAFGRSTYKGAVICFTHRRFVWLLPGYSFARTFLLFALSPPFRHHSNSPPVYGHRYLENAYAPLIAKRVMDDSSYSVRTLLHISVLPLIPGSPCSKSWFLAPTWVNSSEPCSCSLRPQ